MSQKIQFSLNFDEDVEDYLSKKYPDHADYRIINQALDARGAPRGKIPRYNYDVEIIFPGEKFSVYQESFQSIGPIKEKPIIIGAGPAGLFCALRLLEYGIPSIIFERGDTAQRRMLSIARFWRYGEFNTENNVCFGEGGAGLFSDGKLITRVKSPYVQYVMNRLVDFGAPAETAYISNPHLGSNKIRGLILKMSDYLRSRGCEIYYNTKIDEIIFDQDQSKVVGLVDNQGRKFESDQVVLATGHSAKDIYEHLRMKKIPMAQKDFAIGVRIEHPRKHIDTIQYGNFASKDLGAARYRLSYEDPTSKKGTYSFCMCPGGYVLSSGTESDGIVVNGMSNFSRSSPWSNSALVVAVKSGVDFSSDDVLNGLKFTQKIENAAYCLSREKASGKEVPAITVTEFLDEKINDTKIPKNSCPSGIFKQDLNAILPSFVTKHLRNALLKFNQQMNGYIHKDALLIAPETRTSAPVTILRDKESLESIGIKGFYPCGEGAGYAGGITSAAVDGVRVAESIVQKVKGKTHV